MGEKVEATKWVAWGFGVLLVVGLITTAIGYALRPVDKMVERQVLVQSHQYKEGMAERVATLRASLAEIEARLLTTTDPAQRAGLEAQQATINVQINAARRQ